MQRDNSTFKSKAKLRKKALAMLDAPCVMETHGGYGAIYDECYRSRDIPGVVFEQNPIKADALAKQRPTWAVYECDCVAAIGEGVGFHVPVNLFDIDPYGSPWDVVDAIMGQARRLPATVVLAVNDGLRQKVQMNGGWDVAQLAPAVRRFGAASMYRKYLEVCEFLLQQKAVEAGYALDRFGGYYCGHGDNMTHYAALLRRGQ